MQGAEKREACPNPGSGVKGAMGQQPVVANSVAETKQGIGQQKGQQRHPHGITSTSPAITLAYPCRRCAVPVRPGSELQPRSTPQPVASIPSPPMSAPGTGVRITPGRPRGLVSERIYAGSDRWICRTRNDRSQSSSTKASTPAPRIWIEASSSSS